MKKTILAIVLATLCLFFKVEAQDSASTIKPLKIGDTIPEAVWNMPLQVINYPKNKQTITLGQFRDKELIILDFWATWCGACIQAFPKLDSLQSDYKENLQFLLVDSKSTGDSKQKVMNVLNNKGRPNGKPFSLPSLINDTILGRSFIHKMLPHYVWILNKKVIATSFAIDVTHDNISKVLNNQQINIESKIDITDYNQEKPLFLNGNGGRGEEILYRSQISGIIKGLPSQTSVIKDKNNLIIKYTSINASRTQLYKLANGVLDIPDNRVFFDSDSLNIIQTGINDPYAFCYELISKPMTQEQVNNRLRDALSTFFGLDGMVDNRTVSCLILRRTGETKAGKKYGFRKFSGVNHIQNGHLSALVDHLNYILPQPVLDESQYLSPVKVILPEKSNGLTVLKELLAEQGFEIVNGQRKIKVFVLKGNGSKANLSSN